MALKAASIPVSKGPCFTEAMVANTLTGYLITQSWVLSHFWKLEAQDWVFVSSEAAVLGLQAVQVNIFLLRVCLGSSSLCLKWFPVKHYSTPSFYFFKVCISKHSHMFSYSSLRLQHMSWREAGFGGKRGHDTPPKLALLDME